MPKTSYRTSDARRARSAVARALRSGLLSRQPCEVCGASASHAHHDDYAKPLDVRWFCAEHHKGWHREQLRIDPDRVRRARVEAGFTQTEFAALIGCSSRSIQMWEAVDGTIRPHGRHARRLSEATGKPLSWFFDEEKVA